MRNVSLLLCMLVSLVLTACSSSDDYLEAYRHDFGTLQTAPDGTAQTFRTDGGLLFNVEEGSKVAQRDTLLRVRAFYVPVSPTAIRIASLATMLLLEPRPMKADNFRADPLRLNACWTGGGYVNLHLDVPTANNTAAHYFAMDECGLVSNAASGQTLQLRLYHDAHGDGNAWHRETFLSCNLAPYHSLLLPERDSIEVNVQTEKGLTTTTLAFP